MAIIGQTNPNVLITGPFGTSLTGIEILSTGFPLPTIPYIQFGFPLSVKDPAFGAKGDGITDDTAPIQAALKAAGPGGTVVLGPGRYVVNSNLTIPGFTTLMGGFTFFDDEDTLTHFGTLPAILLSSSATITAGGISCSVKNCLIYRKGMTFPAADSSAYAGIALSDGGNSNFALTDLVVMGFDTCALYTGARPYMERFFCDGTGINKAVIEVDTSNSDSGYFYKVKIQPLATGNGHGAASNRAGTGFRMAGAGGLSGTYTDWVVQNFAVACYEFGGAGLTQIGHIWTDGQVGFEGQFGILVDAGASIYADQIVINVAQTGIKILSNGAPCYVGFLSISFITQDAISLGDASHSGNLDVDTLIISNVTRYALNVLHNAPTFLVDKAIMGAINGGIAPYFSASTSIDINSQSFSIRSLITDIGTTNPFLVGSGGAGFYARTNAELLLRDVTTVSLSGGTGLGSTGTYSLLTGSDCACGFIALNTGGAGIGASGSVTLNFPLQSSASFWVVVPGLGKGAVDWASTAQVSTAALTGTTTLIEWNTNGAALGAGANQVVIAYHAKSF